MTQQAKIERAVTEPAVILPKSDAAEKSAASIGKSAAGISVRPSIDRSANGGHGGSIVLVLLVAAFLVASATAMAFLGTANAEPYILVFLAALATVGVFSLFALAAGLLQVSGAPAANPLVKTIVDGAADGIVVTDHDGHIVYANAAYLDLIDATDANDMRPVERAFIGDADASEAIYRLLKAAREGRRLEEEVRIGGLHGRPARWLRFKIRPLGASRHDSRLTVWALADVTAERGRQENVFQVLQHSIDYLDHAPAGFFSVDDKGDVVYLNATLANWLDQDLAQVGSGGLKLNDLIAGDGAALITTLRGSPGDVKTEVLDLDLRTRSGRTLPVRVYHKLAFGSDGTAGASRSLVLNRARDDGTDPLRAAEIRFMRFFHTTPMAIATIDRQGGVVRTNPLFAKLFHVARGGDGRGESEDRSILSIVAERDRDTLGAAIRQAALGKSDIAPVDAALAVDGDRFGRFYVTAVEEEERDQETAIVYMLETTEQRELENKVTQQQKMELVGQLAGGIAHDFNNVLSAIMMATDFLLNAHKPTDPSFADIMQIKQNANRAASLVRHLLAFSRKQTLRPQVHDLGEVLSDLTMLLRRLIGEKVTLEVVHGRDLWPVKADISQFEQVIVNLAVNARDAMPNGGRLKVRTANVPAAECARFRAKGMPAADYVLVEVADTGTGIPAKIVDKIFEPFFSTKEVGKGTGLGLSTVYGIIKQTGGFVYVETAENKGATFRIFLPRHVATAQEIAVEQAETEAMAAASSGPGAHAAATDLTGQGTILLVEDEDGLRQLNARGLTSRGYTVLEAANGVEAIEVLERHQGDIDLVVSDVVMPEMDGPTLLRELRSRNPALKIIFVSGYAEDAFQKHLPADGQFAFLAKPFTLKQLVNEVKETLAA
ncbi:MAG TPA: response regulator [Xanthobacteraceae bacterium]|jgi:two-component system cell cycle sensor histidine kinase/response regulator CckA|nr:response regulator [Xanthobacteraceae bacterium]